MVSDYRIAICGVGKLAHKQKVEQQNNGPDRGRRRGRATPTVLNRTIAFWCGFWETEAACLGAIISVDPLAFCIALFGN